MTDEECAWRESQMRAGFEAELPHRLRRASSVRLHRFIPAHWFAAAASECIGMYTAGYFYGAISVAQAYVEALSRYLTEHHKLRVAKDANERCRRLHREAVISEATLTALLCILSDRNDFHHLNKDVGQDREQLEARAQQCINHLEVIELEVFAYRVEQGVIVVEEPTYWPSDEPGLAQVRLRRLW